MSILCSTLVISYNTRDLTLAAIDSALESTPDNIEILVFDNASVDGSGEILSGKYSANSRVKVFLSPKNIGFAAANNFLATQARGTFYLLLNPDTVVLDSAITKLLHFARINPQARIWGGATFFPGMLINPSYCWSRQTLHSLFFQLVGLSSICRRNQFFNPEGIGYWNTRPIRPVDIVSGCFLLIERDLWNDLEGFDPRFFMYGEDADLCLRARAFKGRPIINMSASIIHYGGASERVRADKLVRLLHAKHLLLDRHMNFWRKPIAKCLLSLWPLSRAIAHTILARLSQPHFAESASVWNDVWRRRSEWRS